MYFDGKRAAITIICIIIVSILIIHFWGQSKTRKEEGNEALLVTFRNYAILITRAVEKDYTLNQAMESVAEVEVDCMEAIDFTDEFEYCKTIINDDGSIAIKLKGKKTSRFKDYYCEHATQFDTSSCKKVK